MLTLVALSAEAAVHNLFVWQIFTYMFLHGGLQHLLFNMLALVVFRPATGAGLGHAGGS